MLPRGRKQINYVVRHLSARCAAVYHVLQDREALSIWRKIPQFLSDHVNFGLRLKIVKLLVTERGGGFGKKFLTLMKGFC